MRCALITLFLIGMILGITGRCADTFGGDRAVQEYDANRKLLEQTRIVDLKLVDATPEQAFLSVVEQSRRLDSTGRGLNLIFSRTQVGRSAAAARQLVTVQMADVSPLEAIRIIGKSLGWTFSIEGRTIFLWEGTRCPVDVLRFKVFPVPAGFSTGISVPTGAETVDVRPLLEKDGVTFLPETSAVYRPRRKLLVMRNTQENLDLVEAILEAAAKGP